MTIQMQMKTGKKTKQDEKLLHYDSEEDDFFYNCDLCSFENIFDDQFKHHKKSKNRSKSKRKADIWKQIQALEKEV